MLCIFTPHYIIGLEVLIVDSECKDFELPVTSRSILLFHTEKRPCVLIRDCGYEAVLLRSTPNFISVVLAMYMQFFSKCCQDVSFNGLNNILRYVVNYARL